MSVKYAKIKKTDSLHTGWCDTLPHWPISSVLHPNNLTCVWSDEVLRAEMGDGDLWFDPRCNPWLINLHRLATSCSYITQVCAICFVQSYTVLCLLPHARTRARPRPRPHPHPHTHLYRTPFISFCVDIVSLEVSDVDLILEWLLILSYCILAVFVSTVYLQGTGMMSTTCLYSEHTLSFLLLHDFWNVYDGEALAAISNIALGSSCIFSSWAPEMVNGVSGWTWARRCSWLFPS